jgi:hypothetical protein
MTDNDRFLEDARQHFAALSERAIPGAGCPPPEEIWDAVKGVASAQETESIVSHTAACPSCAEAWRLGHDLIRSGAPLSMPGAPRQGARMFRRTLALALAAAVLLVAGAGIVRTLLQPSPVAMRAGEDAVIISLVPETAALHRGSATLRWSDAGEGARYSVRVGTSDLTAVAGAEGLDQPRYTIPPESLEHLPAGASLVWRVEAVFPDGRRIASPAFKNAVE